MKDLDFREKYGITPKGFADKHLGQYRESGDELRAKKCPICNPTKRDNFWTFSINRESGAYNCKRDSCGARGSFHDILVEFNEIDEDLTVEKNRPDKSDDLGISKLTNTSDDYENPDTSDSTTDLSDEILDWFEWRGISEETVAYWGIMQEEHKIRNKFDYHMAFPYYDKSGEEIVLLKYRVPNRKTDDKFIWEAGSGKKVLWGLNKLDSDQQLVITEGEIDAMSLTEAGIDNVTSIPFGAEKYKWLDNNWDLVDQFDDIILWMDTDSAGQKTTEELIKRLGKWRCKVVTSAGYKDANKTLFKEGEEAVREAIEEAEEIEVNGLHNMSDIESWDPTEQDKILSSIEKVNEEMQGYFLPSVTITTGLSGSGKSTFVNQEAIHSVSQGYKTLIYSGELKSPLIRYWVERQACTPKFIAKKEDEDTGMTNYYVPREYKEMLRSWYSDLLYVYDIEYATQGEQINYQDRLVTAEKLLSVFEYAVQRYGVEYFVVDNLMTINFGLGLDNKFEEQARFLAMIKNFANQFDVAVNLIAHPRKNEPPITIQDISGTMNIVNFVDNILSLSRIDTRDNDDLPSQLKDKDSAVTFLKDRLYGTKKQTEGLYFNEPTKRFYKSDKQLKTPYDWGPQKKELI